MSAPGYPGLPLAASPREIAERVNGLLRGKLNAVTTVTLAVDADTTLLEDPRLGPASFVGLSPLTASAKAEGHPFVTARTNGSCVLAHANSPVADRTYDVLVIA